MTDRGGHRHIHGCVFSHIAGRYTDQNDRPWDYRAVIGEHLTLDMRILDIDTGGGEFHLSLGHPYEITATTENYPPNIELCRQILTPLGINYRTADGKSRLPFDDSSFHMVIDRHGDFDPEEIFRVLRPSGPFITQQVGAENDRELVLLLCGNIPIPFPGQYLSIAESRFRTAGLEILRSEEGFRLIRFFDTGALTWFSCIIQ